MVQDAEKYRKEDEEATSCFTAHNSLESYTYNIKNTLKDDKVTDKIDQDDKAKLEAAVNKTAKWLDNSQEASKDEYEEKQKELEGVANPIMMKFYWANIGESCRNSIVELL